MWVWVCGCVWVCVGVCVCVCVCVCVRKQSTTEKTHRIQGNLVLVNLDFNAVEDATLHLAAFLAKHLKHSLVPEPNQHRTTRRECVKKRETKLKHTLTHFVSVCLSLS